MFSSFQSFYSHCSSDGTVAPSEMETISKGALLFINQQLLNLVKLLIHCMIANFFKSAVIAVLFMKLQLLNMASLVSSFILSLLATKEKYQWSKGAFAFSNFNGLLMVQFLKFTMSVSKSRALKYRLSRVIVILNVFF